MEKTCTKCKETKDISLFAKDKNSPDGHTYQCKECRNKANKRYRELHPDKIQEHNSRLKN